MVYIDAHGEQKGSWAVFHTTNTACTPTARTPVSVLSPPRPLSFVVFVPQSSTPHLPRCTSLAPVSRRRGARNKEQGDPAECSIVCHRCRASVHIPSTPTPTPATRAPSFHPSYFLLLLSPRCKTASSSESLVLGRQTAAPSLSSPTATAIMMSPRPPAHAYAFLPASPSDVYVYASPPASERASAPHPIVEENENSLCAKAGVGAGAGRG
ncbi:hypothetical protein B0H13DRAFT_2664193 [Mycena leptocephala]|nr:hypothetical protein B0H13DRAFT_2664193 [Mycena leptocephala]